MSSRHRGPTLSLFTAGTKFLFIFMGAPEKIPWKKVNKFRFAKKDYHSLRTFRPRPPLCFRPSCYLSRSSLASFLRLRFGCVRLQEVQKKHVDFAAEQISPIRELSWCLINYCLSSEDDLTTGCDAISRRSQL